MVERMLNGRVIEIGESKTPGRESKLYGRGGEEEPGMRSWENRESKSAL